jgi:hypothetical protein
MAGPAPRTPTTSNSTTFRQELWDTTVVTGNAKVPASDLNISGTTPGTWQPDNITCITDKLEMTGYAPPVSGTTRAFILKPVLP